MDEQTQNSQEKTVLKIIQEINSGACDPLTLDKTTRQQCIEVLVGEGYTYSQLAQLLKRSEKTIARDMQEIRQQNALSPSVDFAKEAVGELITKARIHASYLMRLARDKDSPTNNKAAAEFLAWRVIKELTEKLQTLGYLPFKPQEVMSDIYHHFKEDEDDSFDGVRKMLSEIESVAKDTGVLVPELTKEIQELEAKIERAEIVDQVNKLSQKQKDHLTNKEDNHEQTI